MTKVSKQAQRYAARFRLSEMGMWSRNSVRILMTLAYNAGQRQVSRRLRKAVR